MGLGVPVEEMLAHAAKKMSRNEADANRAEWNVGMDVDISTVAR